MDRWTDRCAEPARPALPSEVDKVLAGLEILSKVFDQQSSPMVSKILQQVRGAQRYGGANPHPGGRPHGPATAPSMGICGAGSPILPLWNGSGGSHPALTHGARGVLPCSVVLRGGPSLLGRGGGSRIPILLCCTVLGWGEGVQPFWGAGMDLRVLSCPVSWW